MNKQFYISCLVLLVFLAGVAVAAPEPVDDAPAKVKKSSLDYIAIVNEQKITMGDYVSALRRGAKDRFYHGKVEEGEAKKFRKEVAEELVERELLVQEAARRKLEPDLEEVEASVKAFDAKFQADPEWSKARDKILPKVRAKLTGDSLVKVIKEVVKAVKPPTADALKKYYAENEELFTTPSRNHVSLILLKVDPASTSDVWKEASKEGTSIVDRINGGADFAELARIHSSDKSAENGGDMGFIHTGMLGDNAQKILDIMEPGETSAPVVLLEGVAIFRLVERTTPELNSFESVEKRALKLYQRDKSEKAWEEFLLKLHADASVEINDEPWR